MNHELLITYTCLLLLVFIVYQKKKKTFDTGGFLLLVYFIGSVFAVMIHEDKFGEPSFFIPVIYLFFALMISFTPFMKFNTKKTDVVFPVKKIITLLSWIFVISTLLGMATSSTNVIEGLQMVMLEETYGLDLYNNMTESVEGSGHFASNIPMIIMNAMYTFAALLLFVNMTYEKKNKLLISLIAFCLFYGAIKYISIGERGGLVNRSLIVLVSYICMKDYLSESINKKVRKIGLVVGVLLLVPFMALTISRFGNTNEGTTNSLFNYAGQGTVHFCQYALDNNGIRYGDRTVSLFKRIVGFPNTPHNFLERRAKYPQLKINDEVFSTFVGDFVIDFGPVLALLIIILFSLLLTSMVKMCNKRMKFHYFILLHFSMCAIVQGVSLFQYSDSGNLTIIFYLLMYIYLKNANVYVPKKVKALAVNNVSING